MWLLFSFCASMRNELRCFFYYLLNILLIRLWTLTEWVKKPEICLISADCVFSTLNDKINSQCKDCGRKGKSWCIRGVDLFGYVHADKGCEQEIEQCLLTHTYTLTMNITATTLFSERWCFLMQPSILTWTQMSLAEWQRHIFCHERTTGC